MKERFGITEMEVTDEVFRSKYARQFDQAENRMHSINASVDKMALPPKATTTFRLAISFVLSSVLLNFLDNKTSQRFVIFPQC